MANRLMIFLLGVCLCCTPLLNAQSKGEYEYNCEYFDNAYTCAIHRYGDTILVISGLFEEIFPSNDVTFTFNDDCVYLTVNGQKGLFGGNSEIGSWNNTGEEYQRVTIKWDSLFCGEGNDTIFKFEFIPYYQEKNPYRANDGTEIFLHYCDMTSYYWTRLEGIIAFEGEYLYVRKDQESFKTCLKNIK